MKRTVKVDVPCSGCGRTSVDHYARGFCKPCYNVKNRSQNTFWRLRSEDVSNLVYVSGDIPDNRKDLHFFVKPGKKGRMSLFECVERPWQFFALKRDMIKSRYEKK